MSANIVIPSKTTGVDITITSETAHNIDRIKASIKRSHAGIALLLELEAYVPQECLRHLKALEQLVRVRCNGQFPADQFFTCYNDQLTEEGAERLTPEQILGESL